MPLVLLSVVLSEDGSVTASDGAGLSLSKVCYQFTLLYILLNIDCTYLCSAHLHYPFRRCQLESQYSVWTGQHVREDQANRLPWSFVYGHSCLSLACRSQHGW